MQFNDEFVQEAGFICENEAENLKQDNWEKSDLMMKGIFCFLFLCCLFIQ